MSGLLARIRDLIANLSGRERALLGGVGATALGLILWAAVLNPVLDTRSRAALRAATAEQAGGQLGRLRDDLAEVNGRLSSVETRIAQGPSGNIFTTLETLARQSAIRVESMEPQAATPAQRYRETKVQVVLKGVTLAQMVSYLGQIESAPQLLSVKSLRMRSRADKPELLDVTFTVSSFEVAG